MSNRNSWEFEYTAKNLAVAAAKQQEIRSGRVGFWEKKKAEVMQKIKDSGITVSESLASGGSNVKGYGRDAMITIDSTMQDDLSECTTKIREHTDARDKYAGLVQVLEANSECRLKLHHDDWMFFFGK